MAFSSSKKGCVTAQTTMKWIKLSALSIIVSMVCCGGFFSTPLDNEKINTLLNVEWLKLIYVVVVIIVV